MPQFVVLLRGVNVGKGNRVPMAAFRMLLEAQGFAEVRTLLNSGNAVFHSASRSAASHAKAIGARLQESLGVSVLVVVKSSAEFLTVVAENPLALPEKDHSRFLVAFAQGDAATLSAITQFDGQMIELDDGRCAITQRERALCRGDRGGSFQ